MVRQMRGILRRLRRFSKRMNRERSDHCGDEDVRGKPRLRPKGLKLIEQRSNQKIL